MLQLMLICLALDVALDGAYRQRISQPNIMFYSACISVVYKRGLNIDFRLVNSPNDVCAISSKTELVRSPKLDLEK